MAAEIITKEELLAFKVELIAEIRKILAKEDKKVPQWLRSSQVRKMLNISPNTLQSLRVNGTLSFNKVGGIIYYQYDDIVKLMNGKVGSCTD